MATTLYSPSAEAERAEAESRMLAALPEWIRDSVAEVAGKPAVFFGSRFWSASVIVRQSGNFGRDFALVYVNLLSKRPSVVIEATFDSLDDAVEAWRA